MKILIVSNHFWPANFRINDLAIGMVERGHDVTVMAGIPDYPQGKFQKGFGFFRRRREVYQGVKVHRIPLIPRGGGQKWRLAINYLSSAFCFCLYAPLIGRKDFDAVFVFDTSPVTIALPAVVIKWLYKVPIVMWVLDLWPESISATGAITNKTILGGVRKLVRFIYRQCDRILISSQGFEDKVHQVGGYDGDVIYFPNWVEPSIAAANTTAAVELPELPSGFRIVFTGNLGVAQDFEKILTAAEQLKDYTDIHWLIVGDGRQLEWVRSEVQRRGLREQFHLLGRYPLDTMPYFFESADALLLSLKRDPIFSLTAPGKLQSYLSSGRPILATLDGEGADIVDRANAGTTCPAQDAAALV
ncbi:MAG: glycosyltransferase family 4 protein, partial [Bythopirellula sp.]